MIKKYFFLAMLFFFSFQGISQNNYVVNPIPFQPFTGSLTALSTNDDMCSPLISLPFSFDFYGNTYNQIVVSTNGYIDFRSSSANGFSPWIFNLTIPNASFEVKNSIFGAFHDMNNSNAQGSVSYGTYGTSPNRKFVVYYDNNSLFSCNNSHSSFQIILFEASSIIDVQLIDKQNCPNWNSGNTLTGLIDATGANGIAPPNRNTGSWTAFHEGWRFTRPGYYENYSFVRCDDDNDGFQNFDLTVAQNDLFPVSSSVSFYTDASLTNVIANPINFTNLSNPQIIYASGNGMIKQVILEVIDCTIDADNDTVPNDVEDTNGDTNLANDDTDSDGIPNYLDNDDDGDLILTNLEYVFNKNTTSLLDTDNDTIPNYLDNDDDGDGTLTFLEDYNGDGNPANDDTNTNGTPDYLEQSVTLGVNNVELKQDITLFPNPVNDVLNIKNNSGNTISSIAIYSVNGALISELKPTETNFSISTINLQSGIYFVKIIANDDVLNYKFIKE